MKKFNSTMEKNQEYQTPKTIVVELQNEGTILSASLDDTIENGGTIGSTEQSISSLSLFDDNL